MGGGEYLYYGGCRCSVSAVRPDCEIGECAIAQFGGAEEDALHSPPVAVETDPLSNGLGILIDLPLEFLGPDAVLGASTDDSHDFFHSEKSAGSPEKPAWYDSAKKGRRSVGTVGLIPFPPPQVLARARGRMGRTGRPDIMPHPF